jgi:cytosine/adenosine deaminase-related metal-dependent hydrolase
MMKPAYTEQGGVKTRFPVNRETASFLRFDSFGPKLSNRKNDAVFSVDLAAATRHQCDMNRPPPPWIRHEDSWRTPLFINAHTHSEWNARRCLANGDGMVPWIERVLARPLERGEARAGIEATRRLMREAGVGAIGDHGAMNSSVAAGLIPGRHFREYIRIPDSVETDGSLSPHAVHTVDAASLASLRGRNAFLSVHAGESLEERELYETGKGPLANLLIERGFPAAHLEALKGRSPAALLDEHGLLGPRAVLVHAIHLPESDFALIARRGAHVALCPLSNAAIGTAFVPGPLMETGRRAVQAMIDLGVSLALGTDSTLSAPELSMLANARLLVESGIAPDDVLPMLWNASAIGIEPAPRGDKLVAFPDRGDPADSILNATRFEVSES